MRADDWGMDTLSWDALREAVTTIILSVRRCATVGSLPSVPSEIAVMICQQMRETDANVGPFALRFRGCFPCVTRLCAGHYNAAQSEWRSCHDCDAIRSAEESAVGDGKSVDPIYCPDHFTTCRRIVKPPGEANGEQSDDDDDDIYSWSRGELEDRQRDRVGTVCNTTLCHECSAQAQRRDAYSGHFVFDHMCGGFNLLEEE